jgi:hypothetical protein
MQFRVQFVDGNASVILDLIADARNAAGAIALVADLEWPPHAVTMRMLYVDRERIDARFRWQGVVALEADRTGPRPHATRRRRRTGKR